MLWLLEELGAEYNLKLYSRTAKTYRAPPELREVQELGKSPILVTPDGRTITETSAIVLYLLTDLDPTGRFAASDEIRDETLTSFAGASLGPVLALELIFDLAAKHTPWPASYLMRLIRKSIQNNFTMKELTADLSFLEKELGDREWFNGVELGRSDVMLSWPFDMIAQRGWVSFDEYPKIHAWRERIQQRPAWRRALEKGNGYDLTSW